MSLLDAIWLGVVQGLTEFLPVSSDGHLSLAHAFLGVTGDEDLFFDLVLHLGTLIAVLSVFGKDIARFTVEGIAGLRSISDKGFARAFSENEGLRMGLLIVLASLPTAIIGLLLKKPIEGHAFGVPAVALMIMVNGVTLWSSRYAEGRESGARGPLSVSGIGPRQALLIGIAQGLAVLPGISRSGSTIVASLWLGAERERAAQYSFLLSVPAIVGAFVLELDDASLAHAVQVPTPYMVGALVSAIVGVVALRVLLRALRKARFHHFAWYCWGLGLVALAWYGAKA